MKILFDIISLQSFHNGGEEYTRIVLSKLLELNVDIVGVYDSSIVFLDNDEKIFKETIKLYDIQRYKISEIIKLENIDRFYIGIGQRLMNYDLSNINCKVICTIHDVFDVELFEKNLMAVVRPLSLKDHLKKHIKSILNYHVYNPIKSYKNLIDLLLKDDNLIITVSEYSKFSIRFFFPKLIHKEIKVLYSVPKNNKKNEEFESNFLKDLDLNTFPYILAVSANRITKNINLLKEVFYHLKEEFPDLKLVLANSDSERCDKDIIYLKFVSEGDLELLFDNAWVFVYPSIIEGFGYPPVQAMKYGTPVLSSNVTSMPEILGDGALFFSPYYPSDLFEKFFILRENYVQYVSKSMNRYKEISKRQEEDLKKLIELIVN